MKLESVIVPLDGSRAALAALPVGAALGRLFDATIHLLHLGTAETPSGELLEQLGLNARELRGAVLTPAYGEGARAIVRAAALHPHPVIVMGTVTAAGAAQETPGLAEAVLAAASCPVLLVAAARGAEAWTLRRILLPHDGSPTMAAALRPAAALAFRSGAELVVLHVQLAGRPSEPGRLPVPRYVDEPQHEWPTWSREFAERLYALGHPPGAISLRPLAGFGEPREEVRRHAACLQPDLLVLGWDGRPTGVGGEVLRTALRDVASPVLVVPLALGRIDRRAFDAVLFDLDGVITKTAAVHASAWKRLFDEYLSHRSAREGGTSFEPFDIDRDYRTYVDGKPRYDGVQSFLASRSVVLPHGSPDDPPDAETVCGLGNRKNRYFQEHLRRHGVEIYAATVDFVRQARARGLRTALVSSSKNAGEVLEAAEISSLFDTRVDGVEVARLGLSGKPAPDMFLEAARRLGVSPLRAVVVEDAVSGVEAGRAGGFGLVVGVDRNGHAEALRRGGADIVVAELHQLALGE